MEISILGVFSEDADEGVGRGAGVMGLIALSSGLLLSCSLPFSSFPGVGALCLVFALGEVVVEVVVGCSFLLAVITRSTLSRVA